MGEARNALVAHAADALVVIGGGPGTLTEACFAWSFKKPVVVLTSVAGLVLQGGFVGQALDGRPPLGRAVQGAATPSEAVQAVAAALLQAGRLK